MLDAKILQRYLDGEITLSEAAEEMMPVVREYLERDSVEIVWPSLYQNHCGKEALRDSPDVVWFDILINGRLRSVQLANCLSLHRLSVAELRLVLPALRDAFDKGRLPAGVHQWISNNERSHIIGEGAIGSIFTTPILSADEFDKLYGL